MRRAIAGILAGAALAVPALADAATTEVGANGNVFTGGLSFTPARLTLSVGDTVRWRNTDNVVPHTATEDHGLWDLTGTYGATPANPAGFGPGETRERVFEAGTQAYYCRVHPTQIPVRTGTRDASVRFRVARGSTWLVRARLRSQADAGRATDWSPPAGIRG
jgi:plastocyanin